MQQPKQEEWGAKFAKLAKDYAVIVYLASRKICEDEKVAIAYDELFTHFTQEIRRAREEMVQEILTKLPSKEVALCISPAEADAFNRALAEIRQILEQTLNQ